MSPFKYSFANYFDLKKVERSGSWAEKLAAKKELEKRASQ